MKAAKKGQKLNVKGGKLDPEDFENIAQQLDHLRMEKKLRAQAMDCMKEVTTTGYGALGMTFTRRSKVEWEFKSAYKSLVVPILNLVIADCEKNIADIEKALSPIVDFAPKPSEESKKDAAKANGAANPPAANGKAEEAVV